jgi:myo-inositol-1(or 4)-monophosphatase
MPPDPLLLSTAVEAVLHAGAMQVAALGHRIRIDKKGVIDLVTEVDLAVETCWIFDPIDGTTNYAHGLPIFCASLGLEVNGRLEVAAVYDPTRKELFTAERGGGAFLNGVPIRVSATPALIDSLLCTGFHYQVHQSAEEVVGLFTQFIGRARAVRRLGSAALDLCYVACGRFDGFWEERLRPWDVAGGVLLIEEAGGTITGYDGSPYRDARRGDLVATNGAIHGAMLDVIHTYQTQRT